MRSVPRLNKWAVAIAVAALMGLWVDGCAAEPVAAQGVLPTPTVTPFYDSGLVSFAVPPGAGDMRVVAGTYTKYDGVLLPATPVTPLPLGTEIQCPPGTYVIEEVSELGPVAKWNLLTQAMAVAYPNPPADVSVRIGSDEYMATGTPAADGFLVSVNGQGPPTNDPVVIARSAPFTVTALPTAVNTPGAIQAWRERFNAAETISAPIVSVPDMDEYQTVRDTDGKVFDFIQQGVDYYAGRTGWFQMSMGAGTHGGDCQKDGGSFGSNNPYGNEHSYAGVSPARSFTLNAKGSAKITMAITATARDGSRKSEGILIVPSWEPLTGAGFNFSGYDQGPQVAVDPDNLIIQIRLLPDAYAVTLGEGFKGEPNAPNIVAFTGAAGQGFYAPRRVNGHGLDCASFVEVYLTANHIALTEDGVVGFSLPLTGCPWIGASTGFRVAFEAQCYHTALLQQDQEAYYPSDFCDIDPTRAFVWSNEWHLSEASVETFNGSTP